MSKITQKDISNRLRELLAPDERPSLLSLLDELASMPSAPPIGQQLPTTPQEGTTPTIPNIPGKQQLMETNAIAAKYPYLGAQ